MKRTLKKYELIIFDWDGTLMDSESHIVDCLRYALDAIEAESMTDYDLRQVIGLGLCEAIAALLPAGTDMQHQAACDAYREKFLDAKPSPSELFPAVESTLNHLKEAGYLMAIATGKSRRGLDKVLAQTNLGNYFSSTYCADETFSKPHPKMLENILTDLDTEPASALMIGDTEFDLLMALNAGVDGIGVSYGVHEVERLQQSKPLVILDTIDELPTWLDC